MPPGERRERPILTNVRSDRVRSVRALSRRSVRERSGLLLIEGPQAVREVVACAPQTITDLYLADSTEQRLAPIVTAAQRANIRLQRVSDEVLEAMADAQTPQHLIAVARWSPAALDEVLRKTPKLLLLLVQTRDPGNLGTMIRAADAMGADAVLVSAASADVRSPKVVRSTAGSLHHLPIVTGLDAVDAVLQLRAAGIASYAADGNAPQVIDELDLGHPHCWVMGNEAHGLPSLVSEHCDATGRLPMPGRAESLNVSMAATLCLYVAARAQAATN